MLLVEKLWGRHNGLDLVRCSEILCSLRFYEHGKKIQGEAAGLLRSSFSNAHEATHAKNPQELYI